LEEKREKNSGRIGEGTCKVHWDFSLGYQPLDQNEEI